MTYARSTATPQGQAAHANGEGFCARPRIGGRGEFYERYGGGDRPAAFRLGRARARRTSRAQRLHAQWSPAAH
jgi:hypothetical protein